MSSCSRNSTAILFFANSAKVDQHRKQIGKSEPLFDALTHDMLGKLNKTGIPFFHINEQLQEGEDFGERFTTALKWVYDQGFENVIAIGNDTPHLTSGHLLEAYQLLKQGKTVLGPSEDGGFYLLGLPKTQFDQTRFLGLPWQHFTLFRKITAVLQHNGTLYTLPRFSDLDDLQDIDVLLRGPKTLSLLVYRILKHLAGKTEVLSLSVPSVLANGFLSSLHNKGSPELLLRI
ncbi:MAG: DUF2064 domain-containing protein [Bacteroidota bacterium]